MEKPKYWRTKAFISLQEEWYAKLKNETGFTDLETNQGLPDIDFRNASVRDQEAITTYYRIAGQFLSRHSFQSDTYKVIWEEHTNGQSVRAIAKLVSLSKSEVNRIIMRYRKKAGLGQRT